MKNTRKTGMTQSSKTTRVAFLGGVGFAGDLWGGLAAMLVALPSSIAFGVLVYTAIAPEYAGEGALAGILGAAALGIVAPLVSRNGGFITAPCAPAAAVMSALAIELVSTGEYPTDRIIMLLALTALLSAFFQILYGTARAGRLIKFIPYQVVSGYLSGVAVIIALGQLPKLLGLPKDVPLGQGLLSPHFWNWTGIAVGLVTIIVMTAAPRMTHKVPGAILGLLAGIATYFMIALFNNDLLQLTGNSLVIGPIEASGSFANAISTRINSLLQAQPADIGIIIISALTLSVLLSIDTLKTGVVLDALVRRRHDSNRELLGQGAANVAAFLFGGMPGAGTMGATLVNFTSGGRTLWSGVSEGLFVVFTFILLGNLIAWVPIGALAGILLVVAWRMFDRSMFSLALQPSTRIDFSVIAAVVIVAQVGLIAASVVGICLAILLFIRDQIRGSVIVNKLDLCGTRSKRRRRVAENEILDKYGNQATVVQLQGNLFFGTTDQLFSELEQDLAKLRFLLIDLRRVQSMDFTAAHLFDQMKERLQERGGELLFSGMPSSLPTRQDIEHYMAELGLVRSGGGIRVFETRDSAIEWMEEKILEAAGWTPEGEGPLLNPGEIEILSHLDAEEIAKLSSVMQEMSVSAGDRICSQGDKGDQIFLVRRGRVHALLQLEGGKRHHLATFCPGDFFGEMAFLDREPRSADAEAATAADLYVLSRDRFDALVKNNPALGWKVFEQLTFALSKRLRLVDTELRALEER
ncbi:MAG: SLC26A/SulP transporter family protein [Gammaproteobacteria bacterium]|nr:SLC26A/SulP transporter family protein [Gammaproteobacteria bacterium]